ncbi:MAG TPA: YhjD/YihY/BrkB family envelope integrity protein, partial [Acidimicrobiales bacterium]
GTTPASAADKAGIAGLLATTIKNVGDQSVWSRLTILAISGFALVLGARNLLKVMVVVHVLIWHVPRVRVRRQARLVALLIVSVLGALILAQLVSKLQDRSFPAWVFATSVFMLIPAGLWLLASLKVFPHPRDVSWQDMLPGALLVGVGIEALHVFTVVYISHSFERKSETYGAIGGSLSLLLWAYVVGRILAASPVINAVVWRRAHAHQLPPPVMPNLPPPVVPSLPLPSAPAPPDASAPAPAVLPPPPSPFAPGDDLLPPPRAAGNGLAPPPAVPARSVGEALPPPLASTVMGSPVAASREAPPPLPVPVPPG